MVTVEILFERAPFDGTESVGRESTRQNRNIAEAAFQRFIWNAEVRSSLENRRTASRLTQYIGHLVLEILRRDQGVQKFRTVVDLGVDLATATTQVLVVVERLPKVIDTLMAWEQSRTY